MIGTIIYITAWVITNFVWYRTTKKWENTANKWQVAARAWEETSKTVSNTYAAHLQAANEEISLLNDRLARASIREVNEIMALPHPKKKRKPKSKDK